jgi:riboflavin kinase/FMN adenylyltransferase
VALDFAARIRGQHKFDSVDDLVTQIANDTDRTRTLLSAG